MWQPLRTGFWTTTIPCCHAVSTPKHACRILCTTYQYLKLPHMFSISFLVVGQERLGLHPNSYIAWCESKWANNQTWPRTFLFVCWCFWQNVSHQSQEKNQICGAWRRCRKGFCMGRYNGMLHHMTVAKSSKVSEAIMSVLGRLESGLVYGVSRNKYSWQRPFQSRWVSCSRQHATLQRLVKNANCKWSQRSTWSPSNPFPWTSPTTGPRFAVRPLIAVLWLH